MMPWTLWLELVALTVLGTTAIAYATLRGDPRPSDASPSVGAPKTGAAPAALPSPSSSPLGADMAAAPVSATTTNNARASLYTTPGPDQGSASLMPTYPRHLAPKRGWLARIADLLMPHSMAFLGQSVPMPERHQRSHVRVITPEMVIDRACLNLVDEQREARRA